MFNNLGSRAGRKRIADTAPTDGGGQAPGAEEIDALFFDQRITTLVVSDALNAAVFSGPDGSAIHDHFDVLTYVDDENATDLDISEAGCLKPRAASAGTTQDIGTSSSTASSYTSNFTLVDLSAALTAGDVIHEIGVFASSARTGLKVKIVRRVSAGVFDVVADSASFNHTGAGWQNRALPSPYTVPGTGSYYVACYHPIFGSTIQITAARNRAIGTNVDATGNGVSLAESSGGIPPLRVLKNISSGNVTVAATAISASEQPSTMRVAALLYDAAGITLNTDTVIYVSRNNGANWTTATLVEVYTQPGNIRVLDTGNVDVSGQPAGTDMKWRWRTFNTVQPKLLATAMWGSV